MVQAGNYRYSFDIFNVLALPFSLLLVFLHNDLPEVGRCLELCKLPPQRCFCSKVNKGLQMWSL